MYRKDIFIHEEYLYRLSKLRFKNILNKMIQSFEILFAAKFFRGHVIQIYIVYIHHVSS